MPTLKAFIVAVLFALLAPAEQLKITLLATTDLHGNLLPYDYYSAQPEARGLAKISTLIQQARSENPNTMLIDCGDTIQGTPLEGVYQQYVRTGRLPLRLTFAGQPLQQDPMMLAMNAIGYDAMVVGNHEFNFGLKNLAKARSDAHFPWIAANIRVASGAKEEPFLPYFVKTIAGAKVAVIGFTTPSIPTWESPEHYRGYTFESAVDSIQRTIARLNETEHPAIVIVAAHSGLDRNPQKDSAATGDSYENAVYQIATEVKGIDAIVFGHSHAQVEGLRLGDVLLMQPKNWGISLGRIDFVLDAATPGEWKIASKSSHLIPVTRDTPADEKILKIAEPYHQLAEAYLNTRVAESPIAMDARLGRIEDSTLIDAVQKVQLAYSKADVSFASSFNPRVTVHKGPVTVREIAALYLYENQLLAVEGTGKMVRDALENSARYYNSCAADCSHGPLVNSQWFGYNYDMAQGVDYDIDLTKPVGSRIQNLRWHGKPLADNQPLRIAVNDYRAGGSAGFTMFRGAKVVWRSPEEIRALVIDYYTEHGQLPSQPDNNWRIVPEAARQTLHAEALAAGGNVLTQ